MNETSRGGGSSRDPPIGGFMSTAPTSQGNNSSTTSSSGHHHHDDCGLTPLSSDLDSFGEGMTLSRLLAGDSSAWDFDPLSGGGPGHGPHSNNNQYRPWECDLPSITSLSSSGPSCISTSVTSIAPPNVLAPSSIRPGGIHHPQFYQHPHHHPAAPPHHFIDQRLPSFQSQFHQENQHAMFAVAAAANPRPVPSHYPISNVPLQPLIEGHFATHGSTYHHLQPRPPTYGMGATSGMGPGNNRGGGRKSGGGPGERPPSATSSSNMVDAHPTLTAQLRKKSARANSLEGMDPSHEGRHNPPDTPGQVAAISSTEPTLDKLVGSSHPMGMVNNRAEENSFKSPGSQTPGTPTGPASSMAGAMDGEKSTKKKRKRCGECIGCQKKDNCGDCAPCRNDKSHQICKLRRCERLTEKKPKKANPRSKNANGSFNSEFGTPTGKRGRGSKAAAAAATAASPRDNTSNQMEAARPETAPLQTSLNTSSSTTPTGSGPFTSSAGSVPPFVDNHAPTWASQNTPTNPSSGLDPATQQWQQQHYPMAPPRMTSLDFQQSNGGGSGGGGFFEQAFHRPPPTLPPPSSRVPSNGTYSMETSSTLPSPNLNSGGGFLGLNGNPPTGPTALGYNLAVNTAPHPGIRSHPSPRGTPTSHHHMLAHAAAAQQLHQPGNSQPGYPHRPILGSSSLSSNPLGYSGFKPRTEPSSHPPHHNPGGHNSPDSTSEHYQRHPHYSTGPAMGAGAAGVPPPVTPPSFLAYSAAEMPPIAGMPLLDVLAGLRPPREDALTMMPGLGRMSAAPYMGQPDATNTPPSQKTLPNSRSFHNQDKSPSFEPTSNPDNSIQGQAEKAHKPERAKANLKHESPPCDCQVGKGADTGPYYTHLGVARTIVELRATFEARTGLQGQAVRIEKARYCAKEGKTKLGCPIAKYVIRRSSMEEKYLVVTKYREGHTCKTSWIVIAIVAWDGVRSDLADYSYDNIRHKLGNFGRDTQRQCGTNKPNTCACQGTNDEKAGASFSFGCSWSLFFNMCKYAKSQEGCANKYRLNKSSEEPQLKENMEGMATELAPLYKAVAPDSYNNQVAFSEEALKCRIGHGPGQDRPFSGVTSVVDFCAHAHKDVHNMNGGCTVVVTLNKPENRPFGVRPDDEQLHVLSHYAPDVTDEFDSRAGQEAKIRSGALQVLASFERMTYTRDAPVKRKGAKVSGDRKRFLDEWTKAKKNGTSFNPLAQPKKKTKVKSGEPTSPVHSEDPTSPLHSEEPTSPLHSEEPTSPLHSEEPSIPYNWGMWSLPEGMPYPSWISEIVEDPSANSLISQPQFMPEQQLFPNASWDNSHLVPQLDGAEEPPLMDEFSQTSPCMAILEGGSPRKPKFSLYHTNAEENFHDGNIGGLAIALTHGSVLFEVAKHELHATTALKNPDRFNPTRIGLVFYQHRALIYPEHGHQEWQARSLEKNFRDYEAWKDGAFIPTHRKLLMMREDGFEFPESVDTISNANDMKFEDIQKPDLSFLKGRLGTERVSPTKKPQATPVSSESSSQPQLAQDAHHFSPYGPN